jgi:hypothetical protein
MSLYSMHAIQDVKSSLLALSLKRQENYSYLAKQVVQPQSISIIGLVMKVVFSVMWQCFPDAWTLFKTSLFDA